MNLGLRVHPLPRVAQRKHHVVAGLRSRVASGVVFVQLYIGCLDGERAPCRHRIPGIDRKVQDHLFDLARIDPDQTQLGMKTRDDVDVLTDQAAQHPVQGFHGGVQVQYHDLQDLLATERQELRRERYGALASLPYRFRVVPAHIVGRKRLLQQLVVPENGREQVVEVVGDPARQTSDGLHLLGLHRLCVELRKAQRLIPLAGVLQLLEHPVDLGGLGRFARHRARLLVVQVRAHAVAQDHERVGTQDLPDHGRPEVDPIVLTDRKTRAE